MKKTQKRILGISGLCLVVAMTVFAATLPVPGASATTSSVTDTISVRVVGSVPDVNILGIDNGEETIEPNQNLTISYENVDTLTVVMEYTDKDGNTDIYTLIDSVPDYTPGTENINILASNYGYGDYVIKAKGIGYNGVYDEDLVTFHYYPLVAEAVEDEETGDYYLDLQYNADDGTEESTGEVASIVVNIYDENGNLVKEMSPIEVTPPTTRVELPFVEAGVPSGKYTIEVIAYNRAGEQLYKPYVTWVEYAAIPVPDTGGFFQTLNISKADYLITGLIIFALVGVGGMFFIIKHDKKSHTTRRHKR